MHTDKHKLWSPVGWQSCQQRSRQRQVQHAGLVDQHGIAFQRTLSRVLESAKNVTRLCISIAAWCQVFGTATSCSAIKSNQGFGEL